jgi:hypothetical protein
MYNPLMLSLFYEGYKGVPAEDAEALTELESNVGALRDKIIRVVIKKRYEHEIGKERVKGRLGAVPFSLDDVYYILGYATMRTAGKPQGTTFYEWTFMEALPAGKVKPREKRARLFREFAQRLNLILEVDDKIYNKAYVMAHQMIYDHFGFDFGTKYLCEPKYNRDMMSNKPATLLSSINDERAVEVLISALRDPSFYVRYGVLNALWRLPDKRAVEPVIGVLQDEDPIIRELAIFFLQKLGDVRAVDPLIGLLTDRAQAHLYRVCYAAAKALEAICTPAAIAAVQEAEKKGLLEDGYVDSGWEW